VLVCVNRRTARAHPIISESGGFCVNILALEQQALAEKFQGGEPHERFKDVVHRARPERSADSR